MTKYRWFALVKLMHWAMLLGPALGWGVLIPPAKVLATNEGPTAEQADDDCADERPQGAVAIVDGFVISHQEIEEIARPLLVETEKSLIKARQQELWQQIDTKLLEQEAKRRQIDIKQLRQQEILSKVQPPTEADARALFQLNKDRLPGAFEVWKDKMIRHLTQQAQETKTKELVERLKRTGQVEVLVDGSALSSVNAEGTTVLATVAGEPITLADTDESIRSTIFSIEQQNYQIKKEALDYTIDTILIQQEAQKRNVSTEALLDAEVFSKVEPVTDEQVKAFYTQHQAQMNADINRPQDRARLVQYLQDQRTDQMKSALGQRLRQSVSLSIFLAQPPQPVYDISIDEQPCLGPAEAPVTIVEFIDYECVRCARLHETLQELMTNYPQQVRLVSRDFPLTQHPHAYMAAIAAEAAREQGQYWEYISLLFSNTSALDVEQLRQYARQLGLDQTRFDRALDSEKFAQHINRDRQDGLRLGIMSTPVVFVNGQWLTDKSHEALKQAIESALKTKRSRSG